MLYVNAIDRKNKGENIPLNKKEKLINILSCIKRIDIDQVKKLVNYDEDDMKLNIEDGIVKKVSGRRNGNEVKDVPKKRAGISKNLYRWQKIRWLSRYIKKNRNTEEIMLKLENGVKKTEEESYLLKIFKNQDQIVWEIWKILIFIVFVIYLYNVYIFCFNLKDDFFLYTNILTDIFFFLDLIFKSIKISLDFNNMTNSGRFFELAIKMPFYAITVFPWNLIDQSNSLYLIKLLRIGFIWETIADLKQALHTILRTFLGLEYSNFIHKFTDTFKVLIILLLSTHVFACINNFIWNYFFYRYYYTDLISNTPNPNGILPYDIIGSYINNFYYMILTFTTVGYGDFSIHNTFTNNSGVSGPLPLFYPIFIVQFLMEFFGMCIFGYFIGTMKQNLVMEEENILNLQKEEIMIWITKLQKSTNKINNQQDCLLQFRECLTEFWTENPCIVLKYEYFNDLPSVLKRNVMQALFNPYRKMFNLLFDHTEESFYIDFLKCSFQKYYDEGKTIVAQKKNFDYFYMILDGVVNVSFKFQNLDFICCELQPNSFFGESNLLNNTISEFNYEVYTPKEQNYEEYIDLNDKSENGNKKENSSVKDNTLRKDLIDHDKFSLNKIIEKKEDFKNGNQEEEKGKGKKRRCKLLLIKKEHFIQILSKYDKALQKFKMISLFRDDYFRKLRSNIKSNFNEGLNLLVKTIESQDEDHILSDIDDRTLLVAFLKERFQSMEKESNEENNKEGKTDFTENHSDNKHTLPYFRMKANMFLKKKDILHEITQKYSLMSTNYSKFDDIINEVYTRIYSLPFFNQSEKPKSKSNDAINLDILENKLDFLLSKSKIKISKLEKNHYFNKFSLQERFKEVMKEIENIEMFINYKLYYERRKVVPVKRNVLKEEEDDAYDQEQAIDKDEEKKFDDEDDLPLVDKNVNNLKEKVTKLLSRYQNN